eukprot:gene1495-1629_t
MLPFILILLLLGGLVFLLTIIAIFHCLDSRVFDDRGRLLPGPSSHIWGKSLYASVINLFQGSRRYARAVCDYFLIRIGDGDLVAFKSIFGSPYVVVAHPEMAKTVLTGHYMKFRKDPRWDQLSFMLGDGLYTCDDREYTRFRSILGPLCRSQALKCMVTVFNIHTRRLVRHWHYRLKRIELDSGTLDSVKVLLDEDIHNLLTGIMCESGFGYDFCTKSGSETVSEDFETIVNEASERLAQPFSWWSLLFPSRVKASKAAGARLNQLVDATIEDRLRQQALEQTDPASFTCPLPRCDRARSSDALLEDYDSDATAPEQNDLLHLMLMLNEGSNEYQRLSSKQVRDHILTFMVAGYENTANTLLWIIYELCLHPEVQTKCQEEVDSIMNVRGVRTTTVVYDDISRFSLLIQVLKETMRLHPSQPMIVRECATKCNLGHYSLQPKTTVMVSLQALHRHPDFWYLPDEFFPERFSHDNISETIKHPFQYLPFAAGSRNCIGQRFAQMALTVIMAILLSKFSFELLQDDLAKVVIENDSRHCPVNFRVRIHSRDPLTPLEKS